MEYRSVKGMEDILPQDIGIWQEIERTSRIELEANGYREIRTPVLEDTAVFVRSIGETTDIVKKEMFTFEDRKARSLTMRPEGTAPIVRAYIEHSLDRVSRQFRLYYIGPMFRSERPQKGRSRQFHQIGVEIIGSREPQMDAEVIARLNRILNLCGLDKFTIKLNSLGCRKDKAKFSGTLKDYLKDKKNLLCDDCKVRIEKNVLRVLDCKIDTCVRTVKNAPGVSDSLCAECSTGFSMVKDLLFAYNVNFEETKNLVRGLDYYTGTVFEVTHTNLGGQDALAAGGRYDNLVKDMGGPDVGAVGYALGIERLIIALGDKAKELKKCSLVHIAALGSAADIAALKLSHELQAAYNTPHRVNLAVLRDSTGSSLKSKLRSADKNGARLVIIIGEDEIKNGKVVIKDMAGHKEIEPDMDGAVEALGGMLGLKGRKP